MEDDQTDPEMVLLVLMERAFKGPTHEGVRILDWAPQLKRVLKCVRENDPMTMELRGEIERLRAELAAAEAFHMVAVAERNYERQRADILESAAIKALEDRDRLRAELAAYRSALEQIVAPFEDLNFVSGNKLLTYIHDTATAALAAKGEHRPCTCHPNDNPPAPCPRRYALSECRESALAAKGE